MKIRLLQTTDLHMHLFPYDYGAMKPSTRRGLAGLAPRIRAYKSDEIPTLLFDTGDFLQGNPLADMAYRSVRTGDHPMAAIFNGLDYDAIALGNHDFDYGLDTLDRIIAQIYCPVLSANVGTHGDASHFAPSTLIPIDIAQDGGRPLRVLIGVLGLTTPLVSLTDSNGQNLLIASDPTAGAKTAARDLKRRGADLVVALCHFGIDPDDHFDNVAADIANIADIDVVMAGHTHETFPTGTPRVGAMVDTGTGTLHGKPTVMAGAYGSHLGVVELDLVQSEQGTRIGSHHTFLIAVEDEDPPSKDEFQAYRPLHDETLVHMQTQIAETTLPVSTYFSLIQPDLSQYLLSCARQLHMESLLADTEYSDLPFLSTAAPNRTGSTKDPLDFVHIPSGKISRSDLEAIYPYNNSAVALRRNGAQLKDWLEESGLLFAQIAVGSTDQSLHNPLVPPYRFDTIFGLTYIIDVSQPPGRKIRNITHKNRAIADKDIFVLVTTTNRLAHGQNILPSDILRVASETSQDILADSLQRQTPVSVPCPHVWDFAQIPRTKAHFWTSPAADEAQCDRKLHDEGVQPSGFRQFTLDFEA